MRTLANWDVLRGQQAWTVQQVLSSLEAIIWTPVDVGRGKRESFGNQFEFSCGIWPSFEACALSCRMRLEGVATKNNIKTAAFLIGFVGFYHWQMARFHRLGWLQVVRREVVEGCIERLCKLCWAEAIEERRSNRSNGRKRVPLFRATATADQIGSQGAFCRLVWYFENHWNPQTKTLKVWYQTQTPCFDAIQSEGTVKLYTRHFSN